MATEKIQKAIRNKERPAVHLMKEWTKSYCLLSSIQHAGEQVLPGTTGAPIQRMYLIHMGTPSIGKAEHG